MSEREIPIVILLDLAANGKTSLHDVVECIPGQPRVDHPLRARGSARPCDPRDLDQTDELIGIPRADLCP